MNNRPPTCAADYLVGDPKEKWHSRAVLAAACLMQDGRTLAETADIMGLLSHQSAALRVLARERFSRRWGGPFPYGRERLRKIDAAFDRAVLQRDIALGRMPFYLFDKRRAMTPELSWVHAANACWHLVNVLGRGRREMPFEWNLTQTEIDFMLEVAGDNLSEGNQRDGWKKPPRRASPLHHRGE